MKPELGIAEIIKANYANLTSVQKSIGCYLADNVADAAFMNIQDLAKACNVSEASIVRFAKAIGYSGYPDLKSAVQSTFLSQVNLATKLGRKLDGLQPSDNLLHDLISSELDQLAKIPDETLTQSFKDSINAICASEHLVIYGEGSSASLTYLLEFRFRRFRYSITRINESGKAFFEKVIHLPPNAVAIALGLGRPAEELVVFLDQARKHGCPSILITDSRFSSIAKHADYILAATRGSLGVFHSLLVPTLLSEALILGVALKRRDDSIEALEELERLRSAYGYPRYAGLGSGEEGR